MARPLEFRSLATIGTQEPRKPSGTGIYHIMMRGINHQNRRTKQEQTKACFQYALQGGGRR